MRISGFTTTRPEMPNTRTFEDFGKFLGEHPARMGIVSRLYDQYTASFLTEGLFNVYALDKNVKNRFQSVDSFMVEWDIEVQRLHRVPIISSEGDGCNKSDVLFYMPENYYQKYDIFTVERTRQQFQVLNHPQRVADNCWLIIAKINDGEYNSVVDSRAADNNLAGESTRFITMSAPEMHEEGYTKYQSNCEKHRTYISTHRADVDVSAKYAAMEDVFIQIGKGKDDDPVYKLNKAQQDCLESLNMIKNGALLSAKSNIDEKGKPTIYEPDTNRPLILGDGLIWQIERFANKFVFSKLSTSLFNKALQAMVTKSEKATGNTYMVMCNTLYFNEVQTVLGNWIKDFKTVGTFLFSKAANSYVDLGTTYQSYEFAGNKLIFSIERVLDVEFPFRKVGLFIDLTADSTNGKPAIAAFTFKGGQLIQNFIKGVGGLTGLESGEVSSRVAASKYIDWCYLGMAVFNPYRSVIMISEEVKNWMF